LGNAQQIFIDGTKFYGVGPDAFLLSGFGVQNLSITNSTGQNLDPSNPNTWVDGRFFVDLSYWGISQYQYIGNNQTFDFVVSPTNWNQNSGEQILWENGENYSYPLGTVTGATANTVSYLAPPSVSDIYSLTIVAGKGIGQSRKIKSFDSSTKTYIIDGVWNVQPDASSIVIASNIARNVVVYGNRLDGSSEPYAAQTASAGVSSFFGASDMIIDSNTFHELRTGVILWSTGNTHFRPVNLTQVTNNQFIDNITGVSFPISGQKGTAVIGSNISGNFLDGVETAFSMNVGDPYTSDSYPSANMNVFANNTLGSIGQFTSFGQIGNDIQNTLFLQNFDTNGNLMLPAGAFSL
jgi:hypothetical protein